jgi:uncharacterized protein
MIMGFMLGVLRESWFLFFRMSGYLVIGFVCAGLIHQFLRPEFVSRHLGRPSILSIIKATLFGVPLPLCSCGIIPPATSLRVAGASAGATLAFLISTPTTGIDSILATYGLLGGMFTMFRIFASVLIGFAAGIVSNFFREECRPPCLQSAGEGIRKSFDAKEILRYGFLELYPSIAKWLFWGVLAGGLISFLIPQHAIPASLGQGWIAYFLMAFLGVPLYVCATGSIPIATALIAKGISVGAGFTFLVTGPATNTVTILFVWKFLGKRNLFIYLVSIISGAILLGRLLDEVFLRWHLAVPMVMHAHEGMSSLFSLLSSILLLGLGAFLLVQDLRRKKMGRATGFCFTFKVPDISCQHCVRTIEKNLSGVAEIRVVQVDIRKKEVKVCGDRDMKEEVKQILDGAGYPVKE